MIFFYDKDTKTKVKRRQDLTCDARALLVAEWSQSLDDVYLSDRPQKLSNVMVVQPLLILFTHFYLFPYHLNFNEQDGANLCLSYDNCTKTKHTKMEPNLV